MYAGPSTWPSAATRSQRTCDDFAAASPADMLKAGEFDCQPIVTTVLCAPWAECTGTGSELKREMVGDGWEGKSLLKQLGRLVFLIQDLCSKLLSSPIWIPSIRIGLPIPISLLPCSMHIPSLDPKPCYSHLSQLPVTAVQDQMSTFTVAHDPIRKTLVAGGERGTIVVWDSTGKEIARPPKWVAAALLYYSLLPTAWSGRGQRGSSNVRTCRWAGSQQEVPGAGFASLS
jgi:hypothetical protein